LVCFVLQAFFWFLFTGVFLVLVVLNLLIRLFSAVLGSAAKKTSSAAKPEPPAATSQQTVKTPETKDSSNQVELIDVDDATAAVIMAIVSHETGIPLSNLEFKYIKLVQ